MNEFEEVKLINDKLDSQLKFFEQGLKNVHLLFSDSHTLDEKYGIPYVLHMTRHSQHIYNKESTYLSDALTQGIQSYFNDKINNKYLIRFLDVKNLTFGIFDGDAEISRFSLMNKSYCYMNSVILNEEEYIKHTNATKANIKSVEEEIIATLILIDQYEKFQKNYFELFKHIKRISEVYRLIFKFHKMKEYIDRIIDQKKALLKYLEEDKELKEQSLVYLKGKYERSKITISDLTPVFNEIEYLIGERYSFYS